MIHILSIIAPFYGELNVNENDSILLQGIENRTICTTIRTNIRGLNWSSKITIQNFSDFWLTMITYALLSIGKHQYLAYNIVLQKSLINTIRSPKMLNTQVYLVKYNYNKTLRCLLIIVTLNCSFIHQNHEEIIISGMWITPRKWSHYSCGEWIQLRDYEHYYWSMQCEIVGLDNNDTLANRSSIRLLYCFNVILISTGRCEKRRHNDTKINNSASFRGPCVNNVIKLESALSSNGIALNNPIKVEYQEV